MYYITLTHQFQLSAERTVLPFTYEEQFVLIEVILVKADCFFVVDSLN